MDIIKLQESIVSIMEGNVGTYYHGSTHKISTFVDDFVGKGNDEYGPGIYFSNKQYVAKGYADDTGYIYVCDLNINNELSEHTRFNKAQCIKLITNCTDEYAYSNWDEDKNKAVMIAYNQYISSYGKNMLEIFKQIWYDWYRDDPVSFVRQVVGMGYDASVYNLGTGRDNKDTIFIVVYNPKSIQLKEIIPMQQQKPHTQKEKPELQPDDNSDNSDEK